MVRRCQNPECQPAGHLNVALDDPAVGEAHRVPRRVRTLIVVVLLSILAVWGSLFWLRTAYAVPRATDQPHGRGSSPPRLHVAYDVPEVIETIPLGKGTKPIAVAVQLSQFVEWKSRFQVQIVNILTD